MPDTDFTIRIRMPTDTSGAAAATTALGGVERAAGAAAVSGKEAVHSIRSMSRAGEEATRVFQGLESGTLPGFLMAARGMRMLMADLGPEIAAVGGVVAPVFAAWSVFMIDMHRRLKENQAEMTRMWENGAQGVRLYEAELKRMEGEHARMMKGIASDMADLESRVTELNQNMQTARERSQKIGAARGEEISAQLELDKQTALSKETNPERRAAIEEEFKIKAQGQARQKQINDLINERLGAQVEIQNQRGVQHAALGERSAVENEVAQQEENVSQLTAEAAQNLKDQGPTKATIQLQERARAAAESLKTFKEKLQSVVAQTDKEVAEAQAKIDAATATIEAGRIKASALTKEISADTLKRKQELKEGLATQSRGLVGAGVELESAKAAVANAEAEESARGYHIGGELPAVAAAKAQLRAAQGAFDTMSSAVADYSAATTRQARSTEKEVQNNLKALREVQEGGGG